MIDSAVRDDVPKTYPQTRRVEVRIFDCESGEIYYSRSRIVSLFCGCGGEQYLAGVFDSFIRGLRAGKNVSVELICHDVKNVELPLFGDKYRYGAGHHMGLIDGVKV